MSRPDVPKLYAALASLLAARPVLFDQWAYTGEDFARHVALLDGAQLADDGQVRIDKATGARLGLASASRVTVEQYAHIVLDLTDDQFNRLLFPMTHSPATLHDVIGTIARTPTLEQLCDLVEAAADRGFVLTAGDRDALEQARDPHTVDGECDIVGTDRIPLVTYVRRLAARAANS